MLATWGRSEGAWRFPDITRTCAAAVEGRQSSDERPTTIAPAEDVSHARRSNSGRKTSMRRKLLVLVSVLALAGTGSSARGADTQELEHVLDQWVLAWSSND